MPTRSNMKTVQYNDIRDKIEDGDIVLFDPPYTWKRPFDAIIKLVTGSPFTHTNIAFWCDYGAGRRLMAIEAQGGTKRRIINMSYYDGLNMVVFKGIKPWAEIAPNALSKVAEQRYSYLTAIYAGIRDFFINHFGIKLPKLQHPGEICSEFVASEIGLSDTDISPGDLYKVLSGITTERS